MKTWKTKDGKIINIKDMDNQHLINTIKILYRYKEKYESALISSGYEALLSLQGEMAVDTVERELNYLETYGLEESQVHPAFDSLLEEACRRGLTFENISSAKEDFIKYG